MLVMLTTVTLTNNKLWNMDIHPPPPTPCQYVLITHHLSTAKGNCQDGTCNKMLACDITHQPVRRTIQFGIESLMLSRNPSFNTGLRESYID